MQTYGRTSTWYTPTNHSHRRKRSFESHPDRKSYRTTQLIRARPGLTNVPIVAVTAYALNEESEAAMQIGCTEYLTKPFKPKQLLEVVDRLLPQG